LPNIKSGPANFPRFRVHHENRTRRIANDPLCRAAEQQVFHARVSPGGRDDQIDLLLAGDAANLLKRSSFYRMRVSGSQLDAEFLRHVFQMPPDALRDLHRWKNDRHGH